MPEPEPDSRGSLGANILLGKSTTVMLWTSGFVTAAIPTKDPAALAGIGGVVVVSMELPPMWRLTRPYALAVTVLLASSRPAFTRPRMLITAVPTGGFVGLCLLTQGWKVLPDPNPWVPLNAAVGTPATCASTWRRSRSSPCSVRVRLHTNSAGSTSC